MPGEITLRGAVDDVRRYGAAITRPRDGYLAKLALAIGLAYPLGPIDIIPNRLPYVGYLDQIGFVIGGFALSYLLLPPQALQGWNARAGLLPPPSAVRGALAARARAIVLDGFAWLFAGMILRLATGAWQSGEDVARFRSGFRNFTPLPPLLRGLVLVPAARQQLMQAMLASWLLADETYRGQLRDQFGSNAPAEGDCLRVWTGPKVTFLHLEKTAGMAMTKVLTRQFHPLQVDADARRAFPPHVLTPLPPFLLERVRRCSLVWGHYDVPALRRLGPGRFTVTLLRDPRARILSLYRYWRGQAALNLGWNGMNAAVCAAQRMQLAEFLASDDPLLVDYIDNFYVRRLTGQYRSFCDTDPLRAAPARSLDEALRALDEFDFVGISEDMNGSVARLGALLGFAPPARVEPVNVTQAAMEPLPLDDPEIAAQLARLTALDQVVYDTALRRYQAEGLAQAA